MSKVLVEHHPVIRHINASICAEFGQPEEFCSDNNCQESSFENGCLEHSNTTGGEEGTDTMNSQSAFADCTFPLDISKRLVAEVERGNIEYKRKLCSNLEEGRLERLITQLKWRMKEGYNEAIYEIGVEDDGTPVGITKEEIESSLSTLKYMASVLSADVKVLHVNYGWGKNPNFEAATAAYFSQNTEEAIPSAGKLSITNTELYVIEVLVRELTREEQLPVEMRVAVMGGTDSGKSTLTSVLTNGNLDDGIGSARMTMFKHQHEVENGQTSCISQKILGFDVHGSVTNYRSDFCALSEPEILQESSKLVALLDLAGHRRYLKTTMMGLMGQIPDYAMLVLGADKGIQRMAREHLALAIALGLPIIVVINKIDLVSEISDETPRVDLKQILGYLEVNGCDIRLSSGSEYDDEDVEKEDQHRLSPSPPLSKETPPFPEKTKPLCLKGNFTESMTHASLYEVSNLQQASQAAKLISVSLNGENTVNSDTQRERKYQQSIVPVFRVSCVTGENLDSLLSFLNLLPIKRSGSRTKLSEPAQFHVDQVYHVDGVGSVLGGTVFTGTVTMGSKMLLGPDEDGKFQDAIVRSIHSRRLPVNMCCAGQSATIAIDIPEENLMSSTSSSNDSKTKYQLDSASSTGAEETENGSSTSISTENRKIDWSNMPNRCRTRLGWDIDENNFNADEGFVAYPLQQLNTNSVVPNENLRKGMVLVDPSVKPVSTKRFEAEVVLLRNQVFSPTKIRPKQFQCTVHTLTTRQVAKIETISSPLSTRGDRATCVFRFINNSEYVRPGSTMLFRASRMQGIGRITRILQDDTNP